MREIPLVGRLGAGMVALVDDADFEWLSQFRWNRVLGHGRIYASRHERYTNLNGKSRYRARQMQQDILYPDQPCPKGMKADHINGNALDNQRCNLRLVTDHISNLNRKVHKRNTSGYRGVHPTGATWQASIMSNGYRFHWSNCATVEEAAAAYNSLSRHHHGEHAMLNTLPDGFPQFLPEAVGGRIGRRVTSWKRGATKTQESSKAPVTPPQDNSWTIMWHTQRDDGGTGS
jgi:HNH endonuclease